jgi:hypothetical protein
MQKLRIMNQVLEKCIKKKHVELKKSLLMASASSKDMLCFHWQCIPFWFLSTGVQDVIFFF